MLVAGHQANKPLMCARIDPCGSHAREASSRNTRTLAEANAGLSIEHATYAGSASLNSNGKLHQLLNYSWIAVVKGSAFTSAWGECPPAITSAGLALPINGSSEPGKFTVDTSAYPTTIAPNTLPNPSTSFFSRLLTVTMAAQVRVDMTKQSLQAAAKQALSNQEQAEEAYNKEKEFGMTGDNTFDQWWPANVSTAANYL